MTLIVNFFFFLLYNIVLVLPYINMHPPRVYMYKYFLKKHSVQVRWR